MFLEEERRRRRHGLYPSRPTDYSHEAQRHGTFIIFPRSQSSSQRSLLLSLLYSFFFIFHSFYLYLFIYFLFAIPTNVLSYCKSLYILALQPIEMRKKEKKKTTRPRYSHLMYIMYNTYRYMKYI